MKKFFMTGICMLLAAMLLAGCSYESSNIDATETTDEGEMLLPIEESLDMIFTSGAGAWSSNILLDSDGSFTGSYHDTNAGESGEGYDSTIYQSEFKGKFTNIKMIENYAYEMTLEEVTTTVLEGTEKIEERDGIKVRTVASSAVGIADGEVFIFYLPDAPIEALDEKFMAWNLAGEDVGGLLGRYGLYNVDDATAFFAYD